MNYLKLIWLVLTHRLHIQLRKHPTELWGNASDVCTLHQGSEPIDAG